MRYVAAYLLLALGGNSSPTAKDIKKLLQTVGIECDADRAKHVVDEMNGRDVEETVAEGTEMLSTVPSAGAAPAAGSAPAAAAAADAPAEKKEEEKEEEEESDDDMGFGLFD